MSIQKQMIVDQIKPIENGCVHVRTCNITIEDGKPTNSIFHRHVVAPGDDYSKEDAKVQVICASVHTPEVISAYQASIKQISILSA